jgi:hypothetical protein
VAKRLDTQRATDVEDEDEDEEQTLTDIATRLESAVDRRLFTR